MATVVSGAFFNKCKELMVDAGIDWTADTIKAALLTDAYVPDLVNHEFLDDVNSFEVSGTGYTAGGVTVSGKSRTKDAVNNQQVLGCSPLSWTTVTLANIKYVAIYKDSGSAATSPLLLLLTLALTNTVSAANFDVSFSPAPELFRV